MDVVRGGRRERHALGSVRSSLGWLSRFEDAYALWTFIQRSYTDRWDNSSSTTNVLKGTPGAEAEGLRTVSAPGTTSSEGYATQHIAAVHSSC